MRTAAPASKHSTPSGARSSRKEKSPMSTKQATMAAPSFPWCDWCRADTDFVRDHGHHMSESVKIPLFGADYLDVDFVVVLPCLAIVAEYENGAVQVNLLMCVPIEPPDHVWTTGSFGPADCVQDADVSVTVATACELASRLSGGEFTQAGRFETPIGRAWTFPGTDGSTIEVVARGRGKATVTMATAEGAGSEGLSVNLSSDDRGKFVTALNRLITVMEGPVAA